MSLIRPHESNGFIPHILRVRWFLATAFLFAWSMFVAVSYNDVLRNETSLSAVVSADVITHTNEERLAYHVPTLQYNPQLEQAAKLKAEDMVTKGYFAHVSPTGEGAWTFLDRAQYQYVYAGENLAVNFGSSEEVVRAWMNSPTHRANVLSAQFNEIGIAAAEGIYKGKMATFVVQMFGRNVQPVFATNAPAAPQLIPSNTPATYTEQLLSAARQAGAQAVSLVEDPRSIAGFPMIAISVLVLLAMITFPTMRKGHRIGALLSGIGLIGFSVLLLAVSQYILMPVII